MLLKDKVAVIVGGGQGIGRAIALAFAAEGAKLVLASRNRERLEETQALVAAYTQEVLVVPTDIRHPQEIQRLASAALGRFGATDILVQSSGVAGPTRPAWEVSAEEWNDTLAVNVTGAFLCCQAFLPTMIEQRGGSILLIGSGVGARPLPGRTPYVTSKLALLGLARALALDAGSYNVRVNVLSPGPVEGERMQAVFEKQAAIRGISVEAARQNAVKDAALKRFVNLEEIARTAVFLVSENGMTGSEIHVSAGMVM